MGILLVFSVLAGFLTMPGQCQAKLLPRYTKAAKSSYAAVSSGIIVRPTLREDRRALNVSFSGLSKAKTVSYTLIYQAQGVDKGVSGSIDLSVGDTTTRELVFGTASAGVYRYDGGITNARLEIVTELNSGKKTLKRFKINV